MGRPAQSQPSINCAPSSRAPLGTLIPPRLLPSNPPPPPQMRISAIGVAIATPLPCDEGRAPSLPLWIDRSIHPAAKTTGATRPFDPS
ncbi:hypothetical protein BHE74_00008016 [Ensete ventricosum]|nr:hypothetical protein GW17_00003581 [Ensete ventricosum]RWW83474.1 hypothetical protein BHE74_00008016 [Ensete ventricosum]RZR78292.1 hypothetical protein BHM03_00003587 [Ensete ventricosum]